MDRKKFKLLTTRSNEIHSSLIKRGADFHRGKPDPEVVQIARRAKRTFGNGALVIDVGGGQGRNALPFLTRGHRVVLTDLSQVALKTARRKATALNVGKNLETRHVNKINRTISRVEKKAHVVICSRMLHFYKPLLRDALLKQMQEKTRLGGINIVITHLKHGKTRGAFRNAGELKELYRGWKINLTIGEVRHSKISEKKLGRLVTLVAKKT
ncbi:MAG: methyltransferase domain-containing protein [Candidatus Micrarchaeota archaeon]|nr:methyltransferase domain-containing protein [Candidatus Micrarchaeota archaeon]